MVSFAQPQPTEDLPAETYLVTDVDGNHVGTIIRSVAYGGWVLGVADKPLVRIMFAGDGIGVVALNESERPTHMMSVFTDGRVEFMDMTKASEQ